MCHSAMHQPLQLQLHLQQSPRCCTVRAAAHAHQAAASRRHAHSTRRSRHGVAARAPPLEAVSATVEGAGGLNALDIALPALGALVGGTVFLKFSLYSQLEVITAKMLGKYVPSGGPAGGARVLQLGGGTRELYYYPKDIVLVVNVGDDVNRSLMEQAGMTAAVPTQAKKQPVTDLGFQPDGSVDAVVALGVLGQLGSAAERQRCLRECARVLKPGMPLVMVEPLAEGGSPLRALIGVSAGQERLPTAELQALQQDPAFSFVQWDVVLQGQDPHAVGVAVRSERAVRSMAAADDGEDRGSSSKQRRRAKQPKTAQGFRQQQ